MMKNIDSKTFETAIQNDKDAVVMDVRTPGEIAEGIIPGAIHVDLMGGEFAEKVQMLDRDKSYYIYCRSGGRSATACGAMRQWGFTKLYNLSGGIMSWTGEKI